MDLEAHWPAATGVGGRRHCWKLIGLRGKTGKGEGAGAAEGPGSSLRSLIATDQSRPSGGWGNHRPASGIRPSLSILLLYLPSLRPSHLRSPIPSPFLHLSGGNRSDPEVPPTPIPSRTHLGRVPCPGTRSLKSGPFGRANAHAFGSEVGQDGNDWAGEEVGSCPLERSEWASSEGCGKTGRRRSWAQAQLSNCGEGSGRLLGGCGGQAWV